MSKRREEPKPGITVVGNQKYDFPPFRWREAIMMFLDLIWSGKHKYNPRIDSMGKVSITFQTRQTSGVYRVPVYLSITFFQDQPPCYQATGVADPIDFSSTSDTLVIRRESYGFGDEVFETFLARFARNRYIKGMVLPVPDPRYVHTVGFKVKKGGLLISAQ